MKLIATVFSYSSGGAGGIFAPSLFIGGMLGGAVGFADVALFGHPTSTIGAFALVGMGAVFAGIIRAPITSVLIIFELTGSYGLILPLMIANMIAYTVARSWRPLAIYEALLDQDGVHLPHRQVAPALLDQIRVSTAMTPVPHTLAASLTANAALGDSRTLEFEALPVVANDGAFVGLVSPARLRRAVAEQQGNEVLALLADRRTALAPEQPLTAAVVLMDHLATRQLAVINAAEQIVGMLTMSDVVRAQAAMARQQSPHLVPRPRNESEAALAE